MHTLVEHAGDSWVPLGRHSVPLRYVQPLLAQRVRFAGAINFCEKKKSGARLQRQAINSPQAIHVKITPSYRAVNKKLELPKNICPQHPKKKNGV
jgi:hypothetical protein